MLIGTNLLGLFVRSLFPNPEFEKIKVEGHEFIKQEIKKYRHAGKWVNVTAFLLIIVYLYLTFHFWNIGVTAVAAAIMIGRLPDLLWEIKSGFLLRKITFGQARSILPNNILTFIANFLVWASLPALYYFLYHF
jgi:hypothetical protein